MFDVLNSVENYIVFLLTGKNLNKKNELFQSKKDWIYIDPKKINRQQN